MQDVAEFLSRHDPFSDLGEAELEELAARTEVEFFAAGTTIFPQGERPQSKVRIVRRGGVELVDNGRVVDLLGEGELFGHPSMLSGAPTGFEARAQEDSLVYALAAADVKPLLARPAGLRYVAQSLLRRRRPASADEADVASAEVAQQPATTLIRRPPIVLGPEVSLRDAANRMIEEGASSVLVKGGADGGGFGIVTDHDLRSRVVAGDLSPDAPLSEAMSAPMVSVRADETGADVMMEMLDHDIRHVPVLAASGEPLGVIVGIDLVAAESRTPFVLRREIAEATDFEQLRSAAQRLRSAVVALHRAELAPGHVSRVISVVTDALVRRTITLTTDAAGPPPAEFAWLALGSHGRREPAPSSDLDSGLSWRAYSEADGIGAARRTLGEEQTERYMHAMAEQVAKTMSALGWRLDPHGVNATGAFSASSFEDWQRAITSWLGRLGDERVTVATSVVLDGRIAIGPDELDPKPLLFEHAKKNRTLLNHHLRTSLALRPPTGFLRDLVVEHSGEHRGTVDIKHGGLLPVVNIARWASLKAGSPVTPTIERLRAAAEGGALAETQARTLEEAFELFDAVRLEHQVHQVETGREPNDHLDPKELTPLTRRYLRDAFRELGAVQRALGKSLER